MLFAIFSLASSMNLSPAFADEVPVDIVDREDYDEKTPYYLQLVPELAAGLRVSLPAVPIKSAIGGIHELYVEKLLHFQKAGVFSLGIHLGVAPLTVGRFDNLKYGATLRYQLHFVKNQILVPTTALVYDSFRLKNAGNTVNTYSSPGIMFGALLNLGFFDRETARDGHQSLGIVRSYLSLEARPINMSSFTYATTGTGSGMVDSHGTSGMIWYWGLRLEFE